MRGVQAIHSNSGTAYSSATQRILRYIVATLALLTPAGQECGTVSVLRYGNYSMMLVATCENILRSSCNTVRHGPTPSGYHIPLPRLRMRGPWPLDYIPRPAASDLLAPGAVSRFQGWQRHSHETCRSSLCVGRGRTRGAPVVWGRTEAGPLVAVVACVPLNP